MILIRRQLKNLSEQIPKDWTLCPKMTWVYQPNSAEIEVKEWLAGLDQERNDLGDQQGSRSVASSDSSTEKTDDNWLSRFKQEGITSSDNVKPERDNQDVNSEKDLEGWLRDFKNEADSGDQPFNRQDSDFNFEGQDSDDDWLGRLQPDVEPQLKDSGSESFITDGDGSGEVGDSQDSTRESISESSFEDIETPTWFQNIQAETQDLADDAQSDESTTPDWMTDLESGSDLLDNGSDSDEHDLPAWLREIGSDSLDFSDTVDSNSLSLEKDVFDSREGSDIPMDESSLRKGLVLGDDLDQETDESFNRTESPDTYAPDSDLLTDEPIDEKSQVEQSENVEVDQDFRQDG